jgi:Tol biopolymer transport system component
VKCWGANWNGQLGDGTTTNHPTPVDVSGLASGVLGIAAGREHTCAWTSAGGVKCWGLNNRGQLGDGTTTDRWAPVDVSALAGGVAAVAAELWHSCALTAGGAVKCWGQNSNGQIGDGTTVDRPTPVDVVGLGDGAVAIATGYLHSCAVTSGGGIKCWGSNYYGQLGTGTTGGSSLAPVDVAGLASGVSDVAARAQHTCALVGNAVKCWGKNDWGQLGDGTGADSASPVSVVVKRVPGLAGSASRKVHGAAGTFDLPLSSVTTTTEPRAGQAHTVVFTFDTVVTAGAAAVTEGTASAGTPTFDGYEMIVPLTGVANAQYVTVSASGVKSSLGGNANVATRIGFLLGDVNQNRTVTVSDLGQVNAQIAQVVGPGNYLKDVNASGTLTVADKGFVNTQITRALPPARHSVGVQLQSPMLPGETFQFALGTQSVSITQSGVAAPFATPLDEGAAYDVNQTAGPRACNLSSNRAGTIATANVLVTADCGNPPGVLTGEFRAPVATAATLRNNGGDDLALTMPAVPNSNDRYNAMPFAFATALADGAAYAVTVASAPANQTCAVYKGASGTMPVSTGALKAGCEFTHDLVSRSSDDAVQGTYFDSSAPAIGGDDVWGEGRFVAFVSSAAGMGGATGSRRQIFWRDRLTGETRLVSTNSHGVEGNADSYAPAISADGLTVAFESYANNLVDDDTNGVRDVFVWSAAGGVLATGVRRVSVGPAGAQADGESLAPTLSGDGSVVGFATSASNLTGGVTSNSIVNVVRRDLATGVNTLVSQGRVGAWVGKGVGGSMPALSEDGNRLAFQSSSALLDPDDDNGLWDIFVYQHDNGSLRRVSLTETGGERNQGTESSSLVVAPAISGNGRYVAYTTTATNVVAGDGNGVQDVFVVDLDAGLAVHRASVSTDGVPANGASPAGQGERVAMSYDGTWVAFTTAASNLGVPSFNVVLHNNLTGQTLPVSNNATSVGPPSLSRHAAYVAYGSATPQDARFGGSGLFARFTNLARAWWWLD